MQRASSRLTPSALRRAALAPLAFVLPVTLPLAAYAPSAAAQAPAAGTGRIVGRVVDAATGQGISDVQVRVDGTALGTLSGVDGRFTINGVPAGTVAVTARRIGFQAKTVSGVVVAAGRGVEQSIALAAATVQLAAVQVTAAAERGSVNRALDAQRTATGIVNAITSEQIARSPDGDAAQAVQRVSGVSVQDGRSVFVRGLGERYTTTTLNGARLPSPEPERRYVPLDLFPTGILQTITTAKTFTPDLSGDFSGAQVDIQTREFPAQRQFTVSASTGGNTLATGRQLLDPRGAGGEAFALVSRSRDIPSQLRTSQDLAQLTTRPAINDAVRSLRNVWTPGVGTGLPNSSFGASVGGQDPVFGKSVGYLASLNYSYAREAWSDYVQQNPQTDATRAIFPIDSFRGEAGRSSVLWGGMLNLSSLVTPRTRVALNNTYTRSGDNDARLSSGVSGSTYSGATIERNTLRYVERSIRSNQLRVEHDFGRQNLSWSVTSSGVQRNEPDRADVVLLQFGGAGGPFQLGEGDPNGLRRTFGELSESNMVYQADYRLSLGPEGRQVTLRTGGQFRDTRRDAFNRQFSILINGVPAATLAEPAERIVARATADANSSVASFQNAAEDGIYRAGERLTAGYLMGEAPFGRFRLIAGARVERSRIDVTTQTANRGTIQSLLDNTDVLPSLVLNYKVSDRQNLRTSATQTLARPEYRELSPITYLEVIGGQNTQGNANLRRGLIQNYDLRWELFPNPGEVLSVGVFAKTFVDPIERIDRATGDAPLITFANARSARNFGVELEARKQLGGLAPALRPLSAFANATFMNSRIQIDTGISANTNTRRPMVGQAPYVVNGGLTYTTSNDRTSATLLYGVVGPRIYFAGTIPFPDTYEQPRNLLDLSVRRAVGPRATLRFDLRNLLDAPFVLRTGPLIRERYNLGRIVSLGVALRQ